MAKGDRVKLRFSTKRLKKLCSKLADDQKYFLRAHGLGHFLNLSVFTVPIPLLDFIMRNFQMGINEFQFGNKSIRFTKTMMKQNLGFLCGDTPVNINNVPADLVEEAKLVKADYFEDGQSKPSIRKAIKLCLSEHNEQDFMRHFFMVALSTMIAPNSQNSLEIHLLNYLMRPNQILQYDWAGYAFNYIKIEIGRFQQYVHSSDPKTQNDTHIYGSCLPLLAVVYLDFLNLSTDFEDDYAISYALPRFCHVKTEDFAYVCEADHVRFPVSERTEFGVVPFRDSSTTPYARGLDDVAAEANINEPIQEHNDSEMDDAKQQSPIVSCAASFSDDEHEQTSSTGGPTYLIPPFDLPEPIEPTVSQHYDTLLAEVTGLFVQTEIETSIERRLQDGLLPIFRRCFRNLSADLYKIMSSSTATSSAPQTSPHNDELNNDDNGSENAQQDIFDQHCEGPRDNNQSLASNQDKDNLGSKHDNKFRENDGTSSNVGSDTMKHNDDNGLENAQQDIPDHYEGPRDTNQTLASNDDKNNLGSKHDNKSREHDGTSSNFGSDSMKFQKKDTYIGPCSSVNSFDENQTIKCNDGTVSKTGDHDILEPHHQGPPPTVDILVGKEPHISTNMDETLAGIQIAINYAGTTHVKSVEHLDSQNFESTISVSKKRTRSSVVSKKRTRSSVIEKQKRQKGAAKMDAQVITYEAPAYITTTYSKYIRSDFMKGKNFEESSPFVLFPDFHCTYKTLRNSLKPRGHIVDDVMAVFAESLNITSKKSTESRNQKKRTKICFSPFLGKKLSGSIKKFEPQRVKKELLRVDKEYDIKNANMLLFPICWSDEASHWILLVVNLLHPKINFFSSANIPDPASRDTVITNTVTNFQTSCRIAGIFDKQLLGFEKDAPECPQQSNNYDCGLYVMIYADNFDGKTLMKFNQNDVSEFRKIVAHRLINHDNNEVVLAKFGD